MITKEAIEAAARAACEDNVQRIHKAAHDSGSSASMSGSEYYMYPPHGWPDFLASMEAAITAAIAATPGPAVKASAFEFDRYINGRLMAEGVTIERETTFEAAAASAARIASRGPNGEAPVLVMLTPAPDLASENERLRAALEFVRAWAWRDDPPSAARNLSDRERLLAIKYHPVINCHPESELNKAALDSGRREPHPDDLAVDRFAAAMKAKLAKKRADGFGGWDDPKQCHIDYLVSLLVEQIQERAVLDPVDIANLSMMIHERGETPDYGR